MNPPSIYLHQVHYRTFTLAHRAAGVRLSDLTPAHIHDGVLVIKPSFRQRRLVTYDAARTLFQRGRIGPQDMLSNRLFNPHTGRFIQWSARNVRRVHQQHPQQAPQPPRQPPQPLPPGAAAAPAHAAFLMNDASQRLIRDTRRNRTFLANQERTKTHDFDVDIKRFRIAAPGDPDVTP